MVKQMAFRRLLYSLNPYENNHNEKLARSALDEMEKAAPALMVA